MADVDSNLLSMTGAELRPRRVLVAISPDEQPETAERLIAAAHRYATATHAPWTVVSVETPVIARKMAVQGGSLAEVFNEAQSLGAEIASPVALSVANALQEYAVQRRAGTLFVGAPRRWRLRRAGHRSIAAALIAAAIEADVVIVARNDRASPHGSYGEPARRNPSPLDHIRGYALGIGLSCLCTLIALPMMKNRFEPVDIAMVYLLGTTLAALRIGRGPALLTSIANVAALDYVFIPPRFSFSVAEPHYLVTFAVMLGVAVIIANLVSAVRLQTITSADREGRTAALYAMTRELAVARDAAAMAGIAERHITDAIHGTVRVLLRESVDTMQPEGALDLSICRWVLAHRERAGRGFDHCADDPCMYIPLLGSEGARGVLVAGPMRPGGTVAPEQKLLLENLASQLAQGLERVSLGEQAEAAHVNAERGALRNTLLASISHDLRTPLAAIAGAGSMMSQNDFPLNDYRRATLGRLIEEKAREMTEHLSNVLDLVRLETGSGALRCEWHSLEDLIGLTLRRNSSRLVGWDISVDLPGDFPMLWVEGGLIVQLLGNLVDNCTKFAADGKRIAIAARVAPQDICIIVEDSGVGLPPGDPERLFDKFERGAREGNVAGVGLGLAICRAVARLHGGDIRALRALSGGARFEVTLPNDQGQGKLPAVADD